MSYAKIGTGIIVAIIVSLLVLNFIPHSAQSDEANIQEVTLEVRADDGTTGESDTQSLSMGVPQTLSMGDKLLQGLDLGGYTYSMTSDGEYSENVEIEVRFATNVWWDSENIQSVDRVYVNQSIQTRNIDPGAGHLLYEDSWEGTLNSGVITSDLPLEVDANDPETVVPNNWFDRWTPAQREIESETLTAGHLQEGRETEGDPVGYVSFVILATGQDGQRVKETAQIEVRFSIDIMDGGEISINGEVSDVDVEEDGSGGVGGGGDEDVRPTENIVMAIPFVSKELLFGVV